MYIKETIQKHSKYKYTYYQNTHTIVKTPTHTHNHILQNKLILFCYKTKQRIALFLVPFIYRKTKYSDS